MKKSELLEECLNYLQKLEIKNANGFRYSNWSFLEAVLMFLFSISIMLFGFIISDIIHPYLF